MSQRANINEQAEPIDADQRLVKTMRVLSVALPVIVSVAAVVNAIVYEFAKNILGVEAICLVVSALAARYFYRRSRNKDAVIYTTRILSSETGFEPDLVDHLVIILAAVLVAMSIFPSLLGLFG
jgi:hypothetical protein